MANYSSTATWVSDRVDNTSAPSMYFTSGWMEYPTPAPACSYIDCPKNWRIRRYRRHLKYIHVMTRKGFACWMIDIPIAPRRLWFGRDRGVKGAVRPIRRVRLNLGEWPRPPPVALGQTPADGEEPWRSDQSSLVWQCDQ